MVSQTRHRVARSKCFKEPNLSWIRAKKSQRAKQKFWDKCYVGPNF